MAAKVMGASLPVLTDLLGENLSLRWPSIALLLRLVVIRVQGAGVAAAD